MSGPLLLDASAWLAALDRDDRYHDAVRALVAASATGTTTLAALDLTLYEVANVAVMRWRSVPDAERAVRLIRLACPDTLEPAGVELLNGAAALAAEHGITVYDAAYVAASRRRKWTLVSADFRDLVGRSLAVAPDQVARGG